MPNWFFLAFASALLSAASAITQKRVLFEIKALRFSVIVSIAGLLLSVPFFIMTDYGTLTAVNVSILFLKSVLGAGAFLCVMQALKNLDISGALPLMVLTPGLVAIGAFLFLGEELSARELIGMVLLLVGTYVLESRTEHSMFEPFKVFARSKFHFFIIGALLLFTVSSILDKSLLAQYKVPPAAFMAFQQLFYAVLFLLVYLFIKNKEADETPISPRLYAWIILIAALTIGYRYTQIEAIKIAPVAVVLSVKRISVFLSAVIGGRLFKEGHYVRRIIAAAIMVAGAIIILRD